MPDQLAECGVLISQHLNSRGQLPIGRLHQHADITLRLDNLQLLDEDFDECRFAQLGARRHRRQDGGQTLRRCVDIGRLSVWCCITHSTLYSVFLIAGIASRTLDRQP
ncbi:hypothetical protein BDI4_830033 [Burkholderia diffusa]|nr:hypothetical protein BDI4_830033 [Burkholderia diffusa]